MVSKSKKKALGRGLSALIPGRPVEEEAAAIEAGPETVPGERRGDGFGDGHGHGILQLDPREIRPNPKQPRITFREEGLEELAESLKRHGMQEPVIVRKAGDHYELVSGERRVRASVMADLQTVPAIAREVSDDDMLKLGLIENIQREDLNAIELALGYQGLIEEFSWTQEELAQQVGKKRATVTNTLRLLNLPADVQERVAQGDISMGHARALLALESPKLQSETCRRIVEQGLSVRQVEKMTSKTAAAQRPKPPQDPNVASIEDDLRRVLGTRVHLRTGANNRGKIEIEYYNLDDLERLLDLLRSTH